ncbi:MAG: OB-fold nucleic acid binding domain-containing protein [Nanoarchaeota archaeon]|nr:OB-fold nucleic acid binding domain-containing protein [Nanoarchaeota archaeon]
MLRLSYEEIKQKIREEKGVSDTEIEDKVKQKLDKLSGLISKEGAAHIVANELGIKLFPDPQKKKYKIKEIMAGLRGVEVTGRIVRKYEIRTFSKEGREGRVASLLLGDETGVLRVVLWDESHIKQTEKLQENDMIKIINAYAKENQGFKELHLGNRSEIIQNPEGEEIETIKKVRDFSQKKIEELQVGDLVKVIGTVVDIYSPKFYEACPECNKKINIEGDKKTCAAHGEVTSKFVPILNIVFDDGTGNIRVVCFRETVAKALNQTEEQVQAYRESSAEFETVKEELRGRHLMITGRVTKNEMFDRLEFIAHDLAMVNPKTLLAEIH